jgi:hypothetical protein
MRSSLTLIALGLVLGAVSWVRANAVGNFVNVSPEEVVYITGPAATGIHNLGVYAGIYNWNAISGDLVGPIRTFCIEMQYDTPTEVWTLGNLEDAPKPGTGVVTSGTGTGMGSDKANLIRELWARDYTSIGSSNSLAAAFQMAIWEIVYDGSSLANLNLGSGSFYVNSGSASTINQANTWLSQLTGSGPRENNLTALIDNYAQDYVTYIPPSSHGGPPPSVPLPASLWGGLALLLTAGFARAIRRRRAE